MSAVTILSVPPELPEMPAELAQKCAKFDGMDLIRGKVPRVVVEQAKAHLTRLERYHAPANQNTIEAWCRMLRNGVAAIDERDFSGRLFAIQATCGDLPAWVWTQETLKRSWKMFKFFPTAQELFEALDEFAQKGMRGMYHVRALASVKPDAPDEIERATPEQIAEIEKAFGNTHPHARAYTPLKPKP